MKVYIWLLLLTNILFAQNPRDINWKEINTTHYRIIFPNEIYEQANQMANRLEYIHAKIGFQMQGEHPKIPLILSNRSVESNGYVSLVPRKSEWYSLPYPAKMTDDPWYNLLSLHETRHIFQYEYGRRGIGKIGDFFLGDFGLALGLNYTFPEWFMEGDAIIAETFYSNSGRGRSATFHKNYRTMILSGQNFSYEKMRFGSVKNHIPDHYETGFFMNVFIGRKYGYHTWPKILNHSAKRWYRHPLSPIDGGLKKYTEFSNSEKLYHGLQIDLSTQWRDDLVKEKYIIDDCEKYFSDYLYAHAKSDTELFFVKTGLAYQPAVYHYQNGECKKLFDLPCFSLTYGLNIQDNSMVLTRYSENKRWDRESWSNIIIKNLDTGASRQISQKGKYLHPALSHDEKMVAAVEFSSTRNCYLVIMLSENGAILRKIPAPKNGMIRTPSWSNNDTKILMTVTGFSGRAIYEYDLEEKKFSHLTKHLTENLFRPKYWENFVLYESDYSGVENIFALHRKTGEKFSVTNSNFGATHPAIQDSFLVFSNYTKKGNRLVKMKLDSADFTPIKKIKKWDDYYFSPLMTEEFQPIDAKEIPRNQHQSKNYQGFDRYIHFHSQLPVIDENRIGLQLFSDNILNTMALQPYFIYDLDRETYDLGVNSNFLKRYPKITASVNTTSRKEIRNYSSYNGLLEKFTEKWKEINVSTLAEWPLIRRDLGIITQKINLLTGIGIKKIYDTESAVNFVTVKNNYNQSNRINFPLHLSLQATSVSEKSKQAILGNYSGIHLFYNRTIGDSNFEGIQYGYWLTTGLNVTNNTALVVDFQGEKNWDNGYNYADFISQNSIFDDIYSIDRFRFRTTLKKHLWYPDIDFFYCLYVKRFIINGSLDWIKINGYRQENNFFYTDSFTPVLGIGLTTIVGGIFDFRVNLPITITYYYHLNSQSNGTAFSFQF